VHILVADDHPMILLGIKRSLMDNYPLAKIDEAYDFEDLEKLIDQNHYDCIITDISMPKGNICDAIKKIKKKSHNLKIIVLSMYNPEIYAVRLFKLGISAYLTKDNTGIKELVNAISFAENGKKYIIPQVAEVLALSLQEKYTENQRHLSLSGKEFELFKMMTSGKKFSEIAKSLSITNAAVSSYKTKIFNKLNIHNYAALIKYAIEMKLNG